MERQNSRLQETDKKLYASGKLYPLKDEKLYFAQALRAMTSVREKTRHA